ncbi:MAG: hypothetical protein NVS9B4_00010 [Candidatus Acidiferrum sp.]
MKRAIDHESDLGGVTGEDTAVVPFTGNAPVHFMPAMSIDMALQRWEAIGQFIGRIMKPDEDYGIVPGSKRPSLLKPGAEKLTAFFGLVPTFEIAHQIEDWDAPEPFFYYRITCRLSRDGMLMGEGVGSCSSRETKYRYRTADRVCPHCKSNSIIKSKSEYGGGYVCFAKKGGCGAKFANNDPAIEGQATGRVPNPDIADIVNTVLKVGKKRAHVDAVLNTIGASQFFTQDVEDIPPQAQDLAATIQIDSEPDAGAPLADPKPKKGTKVTADQVDFLPHFAKVKRDLHNLTGADDTYYAVLHSHAYKNSREIKDPSIARSIYTELVDHLNQKYLSQVRKDLLEVTGNDTAFFSVLNENRFDTINDIKTPGEFKAIYKQLCSVLNDMRLAVANPQEVA